MEAWYYPKVDPSNSTCCSRSSFFLIFMWSSKRISRQKLNVYSINSLNILVVLVKGKLRQGLMLHWHQEQPSCASGLATPMWA